jgi:N-acetylglucosaminyldiphosphoundecaprenol N-acetyl-beta-D-mannosaminyltransferase
MKQKVLSINITLGAYANFIQEIIFLAKKKQSSYICVANIHMLVEAYLNRDFAEIVNNADIVTPDGMPIVIALQTLYKIKQERVAGMDLLPDLLKEAEKQQFKIFFYGGTEEMLDKTKEYINAKYPSLTNIDFYSPPFRLLTATEEKNIVQQINEFEANLVFVVLGCPKQEKWMATMAGKINAVMIGIGGALPVIIGLQKRAPLWMQKNSLEWLYRLMQEPRRLFKRYFITNSIFMYLIIKEKIRLMFFHRK